MDWKFLWEKIENSFHTIAALIACTVFLLCIFFLGDSFFRTYIPNRYIGWLYAAILILMCVFWLVNYFYIPRNKRGKTGFVLCIYADSAEAAKGLKRDFIDTLEKQILNEGLGNIFNITVIKNHLACKYNNFSSIKILHKRTRGHIYIFGETKKRKNGKVQYFISLDGLVLHKPVDQATSQSLAKDFLATLPKGINFNDEVAFAGFQFSAEIVGKSVRYILGCASSISGDPFLAINLHKNLKAQILSSAYRLPSDNAILSKIDNDLANEYAMIAGYHFAKGNKDETRVNLQLSKASNQKCYSALLVESIVLFSWDHDARKSLTVINTCRDFNRPEWKYNEAFLHFWLGNYSSALKRCERIKKQNYPNEDITSQYVTQFVEDIIISGNAKTALYFWLGFNYYYKQNNLPKALNNFEIFEQKADNTMGSLKQKSSLAIVEIKQKMNIK